jgi:thioredoxin reductase (NADPH)
MAKPVILTVDDEPQVLSAIERDLRLHFSSEYRILKSESGKEALQTVRSLKKRNTPVALLLVDQRMPEMSGTDFLAAAAKLYPAAKKALLTAYSDTQAAIKSINELGLDYYLMKPWDPPEKELYPVLDDLLGDWSVNTTPPYEGIRVLGTLWSPDSHAMKDFLSRNQIPYKWLDVEKDEEGQRLLEALDDGLTLRCFPTEKSCRIRRCSIWRRNAVCKPNPPVPSTTLSSSAAGRLDWQLRYMAAPRV